MLKKLSIFTALMFSLLLVPIQAFAAGGGGEEAAAAHPEISATFYAALVIMSAVTLIFMIFLTVKDNG